LAGHENLVRCVRFSACGRWALSGSFDKTLRLWDVAAGQCVRIFEGHADIIHSVAWDWERRWAISAGNDKSIRLWDLASGRCLRVFQDHFERVLAITMTGDGRWAVSGSGDKMLRLWNLVTGQCTQVFSGHTAAVTSLSMSPDGRWIASGSHDQTLRLWELEWEYEFPAPADWDDGAAVHLENFLTLHTPHQSELPEGGEASEEEITHALTRAGSPHWSEDDFQTLLATLRSVGYGWLRPDGVRKKLDELTRRRS
jgi:WD40 repeat protein